MQGKTLLNEFPGKKAKDFVHILKGTTPFIANLHGTVADGDSWVFTHDELNTLLKNPGYLQFINSCVCTRTILFVGITADDIAVKQHFDQLKEEDIDYNPSINYLNGFLSRFIGYGSQHGQYYE